MTDTADLQIRPEPIDTADTSRSRNAISLDDAKIAPPPISLSSIAADPAHILTEDYDLRAAFSQLGDLIADESIDLADVITESAHIQIMNLSVDSPRLNSEDINTGFKLSIWDWSTTIMYFSNPLAFFDGRLL